jgi:hypothetical protein
MSQLPPEQYWWQQVQKTQAEQAGSRAMPVAGSRENPWADVPGAASYSGTAPVVQGGPPRSYGDMANEVDARQAAEAKARGNSPAWLHEYINSPQAKQQTSSPKEQSDPWAMAEAMGINTKTGKGPDAIGPTEYTASGDPSLDFHRQDYEADVSYGRINPNERPFDPRGAEQYRPEGEQNLDALHAYNADVAKALEKKPAPAMVVVPSAKPSAGMGSSSSLSESTDAWKQYVEEGPASSAKMADFNSDPYGWRNFRRPTGEEVPVEKKEEKSSGIPGIFKAIAGGNGGG